MESSVDFRNCIGDNITCQRFVFEELENKNYKKIEDFLKQNPNEPIWTYIDKKGDTTILHKIAGEKFSNKENNFTFLIFIDFILEYLKTNLEQIKLIKFINQQCLEGCTALHYASYYGNLYLIHNLIKLGADIEIRNKSGLNVIHSSAQGNQSTILSYYKEIHKIKVDEKDNEGSSPLHFACRHEAISAVNFLILSGADVNALNFKGNSPLHDAVYGNKIPIFRHLLQYGSLPNIKNEDQKTPLELAKENCVDVKIIEMLEKAEKGQKLFDYTSPLQKVQRSNTNIFLFIIFHLVIFVIIRIFLYPILATLIDITSLFSFILLMTDYFLILFKNPWSVNDKLTREEFFKQFFDGIFEKRKSLSVIDFCPVCLVHLNKSTIHCNICNKCSKNFDHHCYWINKDISKKNKHLFILLLIISILFSAFCIFDCIYAIFNFKNGNKECKIDNNILNTIICLSFDFNNKRILFYSFTILLLICLFFYFLFVGYIGYIHIGGYILELKRRKNTQDDVLDGSIESNISYNTFTPLLS
ncbi:MAG: ankyrin repeat domain-containing protein [archaeon]|nr:ankyrin repeat domain-containing protein [archaeon]